MLQISRDEFECVGVSGTDDGEVPAVECCDRGDSDSFSRCHDGTVDGPQRQVPIPTHQLGDTKPVTRHDWLDGELTPREITEEADLGVDAKSCSDEVGHLGDDERGNDEWAGMLQQ